MAYLRKNAIVIGVCSILMITLMYISLIGDFGRFKNNSIIETIPESKLKEELLKLGVHTKKLSDITNNKVDIQTSISDAQPLDNNLRANATFVVLMRNIDLHPFRKTMMQLEAMFNNKYQYPYVFLNDREFDDNVKERIRALTNSKVEFGLIPKEHWSIPEHLDREKIMKNFAKMKEKRVPYGDSLSYHHMIRYESGLFSQHELMLKYDYYWRVEPSVEFTCMIDEDPFKYMEKNNKKYGFVISLSEYMNSIPTLYKTVRSWVDKHNIDLPDDNLEKWIVDPKTKRYNGCHFWSNFEIGSLQMMRSEQYRSYFNYLDESGGFYYERWGDAPVHSIYAALALHDDDIHFFNTIGYKHDNYQHCPMDYHLNLKCYCDPVKSNDLNSDCLKQFFNLTNYYLP